MFHILILISALFLDIFILNPSFRDIFIIKIFYIKRALIALLIKMFILYNLDNAQILNLFLIFAIMIYQLLTLIPWMIHIFILIHLKGDFLRYFLDFKIVGVNCIILKYTVFNFMRLIIEIVFNIDVYTFSNPSIWHLRDFFLFRFQL